MALTGITLRIYGGSQAGGLNPAPIVSVGSMDVSFKPMPPNIVDEDISWSITHGQSFTAYTLHTKQFKTKDGRPGQLLICLLLPPALQLAKGKEPLTMLNSILDVFAVHQQVGGVLPDAPIDSSSFAMQVKRYSLEERARLLPLMKGVEPAAFQPQNQTQLTALMRYSYYPILARVARLEIGMKTTSTILIPMGGGATPPKEEPTIGNPGTSRDEGNGTHHEPEKETTSTSGKVGDDWIPDTSPGKPKGANGGSSGALGEDWIPGGGSGSGGSGIGGGGNKLFKYLALALLLAVLAGGGFFLLSGNDEPNIPQELAEAEKTADEAAAEADEAAKTAAEKETPKGKAAAKYKISKVIVVLKEATKMDYYTLADKGKGTLEIVEEVENYTPRDKQVDVAVSSDRDNNRRNKLDALLDEINSKYPSPEVLFIAQKNLEADPDFKIIDDWLKLKPALKQQGIVYHQYSTEDRLMVEQFANQH